MFIQVKFLGDSEEWKIQVTGTENLYYVESVPLLCTASVVFYTPLTKMIISLI